MVLRKHEDKVAHDNPYEEPGGTYFNFKGRQAAYDSIVRFLKSYRRGVLMVEGQRGSGKTRLVKEAFEYPDLKRNLPGNKKESPRKPVPIWVDMAKLKITAPIMEEHPRIEERPIPNEEKQDSETETHSKLNCKLSTLNLVQKPLEISDKEFLVAIIQALMRRLSPHRSLRAKGRGLRSKIGSFNFFLSWPRNFIFDKKHIVTIFTLLMFFFFLGVYSYYFLPDFFGFWSDRINTLHILPFIVVLLLFSGFFLRWREIDAIRKQTDHLYFMAFSQSFSKTVENTIIQSHELSSKLMTNEIGKTLIKKIASYLFSKKNMKNEKMLAIFSSDIPNLLHQMDILIFQLHRIGIEPVLVIDEIDKLNAGKELLERLHNREHSPNNSTWIWHNETDSFNNWRQNNGIIIFFDIILRFKESLGERMPIIIIGDHTVNRFMDFSRTHNLVYHTLIKEELLISPVLPEDWISFINKALIKKLQFNGGRCTACELAKFSPCYDACRKWGPFLWVKGKGIYNEMLTSFYQCRHQQWVERSFDVLTWTQKAIAQFEKTDIYTHLNNGQTGEDTQLLFIITDILYHLILNKAIILPVQDRGSSVHAKHLRDIWELLHKLNQNGLVHLTTLDENKKQNHRLTNAINYQELKINHSWNPHA